MRRHVLIAELRATVFFVSVVAWIGGLALLVWAVYGLIIQRFGTTAQTALVNGLYPNSIAVIENGLVATACFALGTAGIAFLILIKEPPPEPHVQRTLQDAAALLEKDQLTEARTLLESVSHDYLAREWMAELDVILSQNAKGEDKPAST